MHAKRQFSNSVGYRTDPGKERSDNQDVVGHFQIPNRDSDLLVVCDGMGGHESGKFAAETVLSMISRSFLEGPETEEPEALLARAIKEANKVIYSKASSGLGRRRKIGTTCAALLVRQGLAHMAHVGDSRIYRIRDGQAERLTRDHTSVQRMVDGGLLTEEEAREHPERNVLSKCIGVSQEVKPEVQGPMPVKANDLYLLCSDGLSGVVEDEAISELAGRHPPQRAVEELIALANQHGGPDNISVAIISFRAQGMAKDVPDSPASISGAEKTVPDASDSVHEPLVVGRDPDCDFVLDAPMVSARHLQVTPVQGGLEVQDLESTNGTYLGSRNHRLDGPARVRRGDVVFLGSYRLPVAVLIEKLRLDEPGVVGKPTQVTVVQHPLVLGRDPDCDLVVDRPQVSAHHARLSPLGGGAFRVEDLGTTNGTFIDGERVTEGILRPGSALSLGSCRVQVSDTGGVEFSPGGDTVRLDGVQIGRVVRHRKTGQPLGLLDGVSVSIYPSELVGLMGPSGAGKTTFMLSLNGYEPPTTGQVLINGEDLYANFDRFRGLIGYLPQDDIIHSELTVRESLYFTAKLRLPADTQDAEIEERIERVLIELKLTEQGDQVIGSAEAKVLSGGQRKRVNLAQELVTDPVLMFLDEPTSGLSSKDTTDVMAVLRGLADRGRTIVLTIHQPSREVYGRMDHVLLLSPGGKLAYFGPTEPDSYEYFQLEEPSPDKVMDSLEYRTADEWQEAYRTSETCHTYVDERIAAVPAPESVKAHADRAPARAAALPQLWTLLRRYTTIKARDRLNMGIVALQAPVVGLLLTLISYSESKDPTDRGLALFLMCIASIFFGCFNASREIVNERAIYLRERMVNLQVLPYVASKFTLLGLVGGAQVALLYIIVRLGVGLEGSPWSYLGVLWLTVLASTGMGLVLSAVVRSAEAAMAIVPIILIPQIVLAGFLVRLDPEDKIRLRYLAAPMVSRWSTEALLEVERTSLDTEQGPAPEGAARPMPSDEQRWHAAYFKNRDLTAWRLGFDSLVLLLFTAGMLATSCLLIRLKDRKT